MRPTCGSEWFELGEVSQQWWRYWRWRGECQGSPESLVWVVLYWLTTYHVILRSPRTPPPHWFDSVDISPFVWNHLSTTALCCRVQSDVACLTIPYLLHRRITFFEWASPRSLIKNISNTVGSLPLNFVISVSQKVDSTYLRHPLLPDNHPIHTSYYVSMIAHWYQFSWVDTCINGPVISNENILHGIVAVCRLPVWLSSVSLARIHISHLILTSCFNNLNQTVAIP